MFETIKEFEEYLFLIETEEQLQQAKYGEADILAYYESLSEAVRIQVYKDISIKSGKESVLDKKYNFNEMLKGLLESEDKTAYLISIGEQHMPDIHRNQIEKYPLIRAIMSNYQNLENAGGAILSLMNDIDKSTEAVSPVIEEKIVKEVKHKNKGLFQSLIYAFTKIKECNPFVANKEKSDSDNKEQDPVKVNIVNSEWFRKAVDMKLIEENDERYNWLGTKGELALFAELLSEELNLKYKWQPFEDLFRYKNLANAKWKTKEIRGYAGNRENDILCIFNKR